MVENTLKKQSTQPMAEHCVNASNKKASNMGGLQMNMGGELALHFFNVVFYEQLNHRDVTF